MYNLSDYKISIVVPVYNSETTIVPLVNHIYKVFEKYNVEIILVNDCSNDNSEALCQELAQESSNTIFISLRKNVGEHNTVLCGLSYATGDYVAIIDDDFQNPPEEIFKLLKKAVVGNYDVVYSKYEEKQHSFLRNFYSWLNGFLAVYLLSKPKGLYLSSFKLIKKELLDDIVNFKGPFPYIDALILRSTSNIGSEVVNHESRKIGKSNYNLKKLLKLYINIVINFSVKPLRIITILGFFISILSGIVIVITFYDDYLNSGISSEWAFLHMLLLFLLSVIFMIIGIVGEYIGKILMSINDTPQYTIKNNRDIQIKTSAAIKSLNNYDRQSIRV